MNCGRVAAQFFGRCADNVRSATCAGLPGDGLARDRLMALDGMLLKFYLTGPQLYLTDGSEQVIKEAMAWMYRRLCEMFLLPGTNEIAVRLTGL